MKKNKTKERVKEILETSGGIYKVSDAIGISRQAMINWYQRGVPMEHWDYFIGRGVDIWDLYKTHTPKWGPS